MVTPAERSSFQPPEAPARGGMAHIGKSVLVKGELSGSEDLYIDGEVEGSVELRENSLTVGPNGRVRANIQARDVTVLGKVQGNIKARDKIEIRKSGSLVGDLITARITIEDGAYFKGSIDIQKAEAARGEPVAAGVKKPELAPVTPPLAGLAAEKKVL